MSAAAPRIPHADREPVLREQIAILASWVDLIILETFGDIESLAQAASVALAECDLPVIAQLTFGDDGRTLGGEEPRAAAAALAALKITAIGANCTVGPAVLQDVVAGLAAGCRAAGQRPAQRGRAPPSGAPAAVRAQHRVLRAGIPPVRRQRGHPGGRVLRHHPGAHQGHRASGEGPAAEPGSRSRHARAAGGRPCSPCRRSRRRSRRPDGRTEAVSRW